MSFKPVKLLTIDPIQDTNPNSEKKGMRFARWITLLSFAALAFGTIASARNDDSTNCNSLIEYALEQQKEIPNPVIAARAIMANLYQNCGVLTMPPFSPERDGSVAVQKLGYVRQVGDRSDPDSKRKVFQSHYYLKAHTEGSLHHPGCMKFSDKGFRPAIYGYGSKNEAFLWQFARSVYFSDKTTEKREFDTPIGKAGSLKCYSGKTPVYPPEANFYNGIQCNSIPVTAVDCNGFIASALMEQGLALNPSMGLDYASYFILPSVFMNFDRPDYLRSVDPKLKPLTCFKDIAGSELQPGDIIATPTHMMMVNRAGQDPLGCKSGKPDFDVIQSSSHGSIGVNIMKGPDALAGVKTLSEFSRQYCQALKNPKSKTLSSPDIRIIRHTGDRIPGCQRGRPVGLSSSHISGDACTRDCTAIKAGF
jgi:hypothetical protein